MDHVQQVIVSERIDDLNREAQSLRTERSAAHRARDRDAGGVTPGVGGRRARARLGHWLIGIGEAVSGTAGDTHGGTAGHAA